MSNKYPMQRMMAEGPPQERSLLRRNLEAQVSSLVRKAPRNKYPIVRQMLADARAGNIDPEVFKEFVRRTNSISLVQEIRDWELYREHSK